MPQPKRKHTAARRDKRRASNWRIEKGSQSPCSNCGGSRAAHSVCPHCGFYNGRLVLAPKQKAKPAEGGEQQKPEGD